jgi:hypothetical protein
MSIPQTESSDMKVWMHQKWTIMPPLNIPVAVEAPALFLDLKAVEPVAAIPSDFTLMLLSREQSINTETHRSLLKRSLREYSNIWKKLAEV